MSALMNERVEYLQAELKHWQEIAGEGVQIEHRLRTEALQAVAAERERCAAVCDDIGNDLGGLAGEIAWKCAAAIRRGEQSDQRGQ